MTRAKQGENDSVQVANGPERKTEGVLSNAQGIPKE